METRGFTIRDYQCSFFTFTYHVLIPNFVNHLSLYYVLYHLRKILTRGCIISVIILASTVNISHAITHNNRFRYRSITPRNPNPYSNGGIVYIVTFKKFYSPMPRDVTKMNGFKRKALPKMSYAETLKDEKLKTSMLKTMRLSSEDVKSLSWKSKYRDSLDSRQRIAKADVDLSSMSKDSEVLIDSYRSRSLCSGYYQTHWIRDSINCSMFFVCSRNRVDAVLTCPETFVWSNRVTNCVPLNSRWDDCPLKNKETVALKNLFRDSLESQTDGTASTSKEKPISLASAVALSTSPGPLKRPRRRQQKHRHTVQQQLRRQKQRQGQQKPKHFHRSQPSMTTRRQRLGYRGGIRLKNKLLKRRKSTRNGLVDQLLNKKEVRHQDKTEDRVDNAKSDSGPNVLQRRRKQIKRIERTLEYVPRQTQRKDVRTNDETNVYTSLPTTTQTVTAINNTTTAKVTKTYRHFKERRKRKYRRITHSYIDGGRSKPTDPNAISKSRGDRRYRPKSRREKIGSKKSLEETSDSRIKTTARTLVTNRWWKLPDLTTTEKPATLNTTPVSENTTQSWLPISTSTTHNFVPALVLACANRFASDQLIVQLIENHNKQESSAQNKALNQRAITECGVSAAPLIVGGLPVKRDKWPWVVSLQLTWLSRHMCGATLVHPRWLITAAHCMAEPDLNHAEDWRVIFENVKSLAKIDYIVKHPSFVNGDNYPNDIAMLRLKHPVDVTGFHIRHACLPSLKWDRSHWDKCWIMGWGEAKEGAVTDLKELEVNIWKNSECSARWGWKRILNSHMCVGTGDSGACNGDSGGPLICRRDGYHYLAGVTSWGVYGCQTTGYPGVFINVASYRKWIDDTISTHT